MQGVKVGRNIATVFVVDSHVRHGIAGNDFLWLLNPVHEIYREYWVDDRTVP